MKKIESIEYYSQGRSWNYVKLVLSIIDRIDVNAINEVEDEDEREDTFFSKLMDAIDCELVYTNNVWTVIQEFFSPLELTSETNNEAMQYLVDDIESNIEFVEEEE